MFATQRVQRGHWLYAVGGIVILAMAGPLAAQSETGILGSPSSLSVTGPRHLSAEAIRQALVRDTRLAWSAHPRAPLADYLGQVQQQTETGVRHAGFPWSHVALAIDPVNSVVRIVIDEGPHYVAERIDIRGCPPDLVGPLLDWLREPSPPEDAVASTFEQADGTFETIWLAANGQPAEMVNPLWIAGRGAPFDEPTRAGLEKLVKRFLSDQGYDHARFAIQVTPDHQRRTADLQVAISDLGKMATVGDIEIRGNDHNGRQILLDYLGLKVGQPITAADRARLEYRLRESARFRKQRVELTRTPGESATRVKIQVVEYAHAPRLDEQLSREQETVLKCGHWLVNTLRNGGELVLQNQSPNPRSPQLTEVVLAGNRGAIVTFRWSADRQLSLCLTPDEFACHIAGGGPTLAIPLDFSHQLLANLQMGLVEDPKSDKQFASTLGMGIRAGSADIKGTVFRMNLQCDPVYFLANLYENGARASWQGDQLVVVSDRSRMVIDKTDGRLIEMSLNLDEGNRMRLDARHGYFDRRASELKAAAGSTAFDRVRPVTSVVNFLTNAEIIDLAGTLLRPSATSPTGPTLNVPQLANAVRKLSDDGLFQPLDELYAPSTDAPWADRDTFEIPQPPAASEPPELMREFAAFGLRWLDATFDREAWPVLLGRLAAALVAKEFRYADRDLQQLATAPQLGPLGALCASSVMPIPPLSRGFAQRGLSQLTFEAFLSDLAALRLAVPAQSADQPMRKDLETMWHAGLRSCLETRLRQNAGLETAAGPAPPRR